MSTSTGYDLTREGEYIVDAFIQADVLLQKLKGRGMFNDNLTMDQKIALYRIIIETGYKIEFCRLLNEIRKEVGRS